MAQSKPPSKASQISPVACQSFNLKHSLAAFLRAWQSSASVAPSRPHGCNNHQARLRHRAEVLMSNMAKSGLLSGAPATTVSEIYDPHRHRQRHKAVLLNLIFLPTGHLIPCFSIHILTGLSNYDRLLIKILETTDRHIADRAICLSTEIQTGSP